MWRKDCRPIAGSFVRSRGETQAGGFNNVDKHASFCISTLSTDLHGLLELANSESNHRMNAEVQQAEEGVTSLGLNVDFNRGRIPSQKDIAKKL